MSIPISKSKFSQYKRHRARQLTLQALYQLQLSHNKPDEVEENSRLSPLYKKCDAEYFIQIFHGITNKNREIDEILRGVNREANFIIDPIMRAVLQIGVYELKYCPELDHAVIIKEAILLCNEFLNEKGHSFANSILEQTAVRLRGVQAKPKKEDDMKIQPAKTPCDKKSDS